MSIWFFMPIVWHTAGRKIRFACQSCPSWRTRLAVSWFKGLPCLFGKDNQTGKAAPQARTLNSDLELSQDQLHIPSLFSISVLKLQAVQHVTASEISIH